MRNAVWLLKKKNGDEVWETSECEYVHALQDALAHLGYELVMSDFEPCPRCQLPGHKCKCDLHSTIE